MERYLWKINNYKFPSIDEDKECDVLIVGAGITGISTAYYLKDYNANVILIERDKLGCGTTMRSSAKLTILQQDIALKIYKCYGTKKTKSYIDSQALAIKEIVSIIKKEKIKCYLKKNNSYVYINDKKNENKITKLFNIYKMCGYEPFYSKIPYVKSYLSFGLKDSYVFHPLLYIRGLVKVLKKYNNISIYEKTSFVQYNKVDDFYEVILNNGRKIKCKHLVFANHYLPFVTPYFLPLRNYLETSLIYVDKNKNEKNLYNAINLDKDIFSIRYFKDMKMLVGNSKELSNKTILKNNYNDCEYFWHNYDLMTHNSLPLIGKIKDEENIYFASGYNTWGMTNSNIAARIISSLIKSEENDLLDIYSTVYSISLYSFYNSVIHNIFQCVYLPVFCHDSGRINLYISADFIYIGH